MPQSPTRALPCALLLASASLAASLTPRAHAATLWSTGPNDLSFSVTNGSDPTLPQNQDLISPTVFIARNSTGGIFNAFSESAFAGSSPADTEWAFSGLGANPTFTYGSGAAAFPSLSFAPFSTSLGGAGSLQFNITSHPGVVHLISNDTYLDINFTTWGSHGDGSFAYTRATGPISALWNGSANNWSNTANWSTNPSFPTNTPSFRFAATINTGSVHLDVTPTVTSLTLGGSTNAWTSSLDLANNALILQPDPSTKSATIATLHNQIAFAKSHNAGITSSTLPANFAIAILDNAATHFTSFRGQSIDPNALLLSPELLGDANADGTVNLSDLSTILNNFGTTSPNWTSGNFDNAPTIDLTDLADVLNNFGLTNPSPSFSAFSIPHSAFTTTPEPPSLATLLLLLLPLKKRRQK